MKSPQETIEREKWIKWAVSAAESERQRRIEYNKLLDQEEKSERLSRQKW
jgi:hypothetical protein